MLISKTGKKNGKAATDLKNMHEKDWTEDIICEKKDESKYVEA